MNRDTTVCLIAIATGAVVLVGAYVVIEAKHPRHPSAATVAAVQPVPTPPKRVQQPVPPPQRTFVDDIGYETRKLEREMKERARDADSSLNKFQQQQRQFEADRSLRELRSQVQREESTKALQERFKQIDNDYDKSMDKIRSNAIDRQHNNTQRDLRRQVEEIQDRRQRDIEWRNIRQR